MSQNTICHFVAVFSTLLCIGISGCNVTSSGHNMYGRQLYDQGQYAAAIESFQQALRDNPQSADAYYNLAATYSHLGRQQNNANSLQQADQLYRYSIALNPANGDAYRGLTALMMQNGQTAEAFQMMQTWRAQMPQSAEPAIELARMYHETGNRQQATQLLVDALNVEPTNARALKALGSIREESGQYQLALDNYIRSYQANNLQADVAQKIAALQGVARTSQVVPAQPGQAQLGSVNQYVPR
ncbi:MAG: tetratricopeptide repeat protein [Pirellulaceae bacterium]